MKRKLIAAGILALGLTTAAFAQGPGQGAGPGYGPGYGWGPGMMGGWGPGGGRGPGGGPGWGGGGYGPGWGLAALNLTDEQQQKIASIQEENRRKNWEAMGQVRAEQFKLRQMTFAEKVDANAIVEQQKKVDDLRRNTLKSRLEARNQVDAILTPEQRKQHRQFGPWWLQDGDIQ
jgi:Spy/CpxP family protein refolding chaperone